MMTFHENPSPRVEPQLNNWELSQWYILLFSIKVYSWSQLPVTNIKLSDLKKGKLSSIDHSLKTIKNTHFLMSMDKGAGQAPAWASNHAYSSAGRNENYLFLLGAFFSSVSPSYINVSDGGQGRYRIQTSPLEVQCFKIE